MLLAAKKDHDKVSHVVTSPVITLFHTIICDRILEISLKVTFYNLNIYTKVRNENFQST